MSYLTNPYRYAVAGGTPSNDFTELLRWVQSPTGTVTWSDGVIPNYARNDGLVTGADWEITANFNASDHNAGELVCAGLSITATPSDKDFFNYAWVIYQPTDTIYYFYQESNYSNATQGYISYDNTATYSIKCVSSVITFLENTTTIHTPTSPQYDFDPSENTDAYVSVGQGQSPTIVVSVTFA